MSEQRPPQSQQIVNADWEQTPASVKQLVIEMAQRLGLIEQQLSELQAQNIELQAENQVLREQINRTSNNSSQAPSSDLPKAPKRSHKEKSGKKRGAQPGHEGHRRSLYAVEQCRRVTDHYPKICRGCGGELSGEDANPYRHQIVEMPPSTPQVEEHRLHQLECQHCGQLTRAELPIIGFPNWLWSKSCGDSWSLEWGVSPQSEDGAKRHARPIWGVDVLGQRQSPPARSQ